MTEIKKEPIFVDGMMFQKPREGAPEFIKGSVSIHPRQLLQWAKDKGAYASEKGWLNMDLKVSQKGTLYLQLNTWKPKKVEQPAEKTVDNMTSEGFDGEPSINGDEIPF